MSETDEQFVVRNFPHASCDGPVTMYWPGQGTRRKYIVTLSPIQSRTYGEGDTKEEAWSMAAKRLKAKQNAGL